MNGTPGTDVNERWWLDPALARLAFGSGRTDVTASPVEAAINQALRHAAAIAADPSGMELRVLGDYELLEVIGQGGMGVVYRAHQHDLDREVAIKLLSAGPAATYELVSSLRSEAQHAARLQHPNIVTVYGLGEHEGLLCYAMQLVRGRSLSQWLDAEGRLPSRQAASLLRTLAEAMDYAHRLGVLHLDLKPGNILIDEHGAPLIADFGMARDLEQGDDFTSIAGTPSYMAPEQVRADFGPLTPATDVWALGAILYEMVTGYPPFDAATPADILRLLVEKRVRRPSRYTGVPADLEAICLHCLGKYPELRYPSPRALAEDLSRFLDGREVSVRRLNAWQRLVLWSRREPRVAAATALASLALLIGITGTSLQWQRAAANAAQAHEVNRFLNDDVLANPDPYRDPTGGPTQTTMPELLEGAEAKLDSGAVAMPAARAEIGLSIGRAYFGLGMWQRARARLGKAHRDARNALGSEAPLTLMIEEQLALTSTYAGNYATARALYPHLLGARRARQGNNAAATIAARRGHAMLLYKTDQFDQARIELEALQTDAAAHAPGQLSDIEWTLADLYTKLNRWDDADRLLRGVLARSRRQLGEHHPDYLWETLSLVDLLTMCARYDEASTLLQAAHSQLLTNLGSQHPKVLAALYYQGQLELERGHPRQALVLLQQALAGRIRVQGETHKWTQHTMNWVGLALLALHRDDEAVAILEHALQLATETGRRKQAYVVLILDSLAQAYMDKGELDRAQACLDEALANARRSLPANNVRRGMLERTLGQLLAARGDIRGAMAHEQYAERVFREGWGRDHPWVVDMQRRQAALRGKRPTPLQSAAP